MDYDTLAQQLGGKVVGARADRIGQYAIEGQQMQKEAAEANSPGGIFKNTLKAIPGQLANALVKQPARFVTSAAAAPIDIARGVQGKQPLDTKLPFVGESFQSQAAREQGEIVEGQRPLYHALKPFAQVPLAGAEVLAAPAAARSLKSGVSAVGSFASRRADKKTLEFARELTSRPVTKKVAEDAVSRGSEGYKAPGLFRAGSIKPTAQDDRVADAVMPYVDKSKPVQENIDNLHRAVSEMDMGVQNMIADNKVPFNEAQLRTQLKAAKEESRLLFAGDNAAEKAYDAVTDEFVRFVNQGKKDTAGLFQARKAFDSYMKGKLPNAFKKDATGQFLDPRDAIRTNALLDVRRAANEYIASQLPANNPYRSTLKKESYILDAIGRIATKNAGVINKNKIQLYTQKHPILKWLVGAGALATLGGGGIGVGGAIINSSN